MTQKCVDREDRYDLRSLISLLVGKTEMQMIREISDGDFAFDEGIALKECC